jgi:8-oxo-dGTP pyrophosphatase MutT (NUDIX family)/predicted MPP superfamily phosphohydrolase
MAMRMHLPSGLSSQSLNILHLSDIHFRKAKYKHDRTKVVDELLKRISEHIRWTRMIPNLLFITGDIGWSGDKEEYSEPLDFLKKLAPLTSNPSLRIYVVPGNHDIIREKAQQDTLRYGNRERWNKLLENELTAKTAKIKGRFAYYYKFVDDLNRLMKNNTPIYRKELFYTDTFQHNGCTVIILGLNSAWACEDDHDEGEIALGEPQVFSACKSIPTDPNTFHLPLALMHHPFSSFHKEDNASLDQLALKCQLVFRGHSHKGKTLNLGVDGVQIQDISTSAAYLMEIKEEEEIGFQFVTVDPLFGFCYIWPYLWNGSYFYLPNERSVKINEDGFISFRFRESQRTAAERIIRAIDSRAEKYVMELQGKHSEFFRNIDEARDIIKEDCKKARSISIYANKGLTFFGIPESIVSIAEPNEYRNLRKIRIILLGSNSRWVSKALVEHRPYEDLENFREELGACHTIIEGAMGKFPASLKTSKSGVRYHFGEPYFRMIMTDQVAYVSSYNVPPEIKVRDCPVYKFYNIPGSLYGALKRYFDDIWHNNSAPGDWQRRTIYLEESAGGVVLAEKDGNFYFILLERKDGYWILPKGHKMKTDLSIEQTALREVSEETGLEESNLEIIRKIDQYAYEETATDEKNRKVVHLFLLRYKGKGLAKLNPDPSHSNAAWFKTGADLPNMLYSNQRNIVQNLMDLLKDIIASEDK